MNCESCETIGVTSLATTKRNRQDTCLDCACEIDTRAAATADLRNTVYDERGIRK